MNQGDLYLMEYVESVTLDQFDGLIDEWIDVSINHS